MVKKILGGGVALGVILCLLLAWQLGWFTPEPEAANTDDAFAAASATTTLTGEESSELSEENTQDAPAPEAQQSVTDLSGTWMVEASDSGTFVGYRIFEVLAGEDVEAVGRSRDVTGTLTVEELTIIGVEIRANLLDLTSDSRIRDNQLKSQALETTQFPEASFSLTTPIPVELIPVDEELVSFVAVGDLTLHGVTNSVQVPIQAGTKDGKIVVVGSTRILLSDYDIDLPEAPSVASVEEMATMEFSIIFSR